MLINLSKFGVAVKASGEVVKDYEMDSEWC